MSVSVTPDDSRLLAALAAGGEALAGARFWTEGVDRLLGELGRASGASRVWIFQLIEHQHDAVVQDYVFEWAAAPRYRQLTQKRFRFFSTLFDDPIYRRLVEERVRGEAQRFITAELAPGSLRRNLESQAILSMVTVPIMINGEWWGTLGIDDCERPLDWRGSGLQALRVAAELIASALYRDRLATRRRQLELFQRVTDCGIWEIDPRSGATRCSRALLQTLGYPDGYARLPLRRLLAHVVPGDRRRLWQRLRQSLSTATDSWRLDVRLRTAQGDNRWHEIVAEPVLDAQGRLRGLAGLVIDISQRKHSEQRALAAAEHDELTGVMNRRGLMRYLPELFRDQSPPYHLLLLDIDHFKQVNDRYGHPIGDALLKRLAQRLANELRPSDALVRFGGEEFAVVTSGLDNAAALALAERLRRCIAATPFSLAAIPGGPSRRLTITLSLGLAKLTDDAPQHHRHSLAVAQADSALYAAKRGGRNRAVAYWQQPGRAVTAASASPSQPSSAPQTTPAPPVE